MKQPPPSSMREFSAHRITLTYTTMGLALGTLLMLGAWIFELLGNQLPLDWDSVVLIHRRMHLLYLIDLAPLLAAMVFWKLGRIQQRLADANRELENRVMARTAELEEEKAQTLAILDSAADGFISFDRSGIIRGYNRAAGRIFGYGPDEVVGRSVLMLISGLEWEDEDIFAHDIGTSRESLAVAIGRETTGLSKDGTELPLEIDVSRTDKAGEILYTAIIRDISDRKRQEALRQSLIEVSDAVNRSPDLESLYRTIHHSLNRVMQAGNFLIGLFDTEEKVIRVEYWSDEKTSSFPKTLPAEGNLPALALKRKAPLLVNTEHMRLLEAEKEIGEPDEHLTSWLGVPLMKGGVPLGVMAVSAYEGVISFNERDVWIMSFVSGQIATAIDRERAREDLRQSERRYRRLVEEGGDIVYTTDLSGRLTYVNPPTLQLTGYEEQELLGQPVTELVPAARRAEVIQSREEQIARKNREDEREFPITRKDGTTVWIEERSTLQMEGDRVTGVQSLVHDITERHEAEGELRRREERFRSLSASSPIGIFQLDRSGKCTYVNRRFEEITGRTLDECLEWGWIESIHPDERDTFRTEWIFSRDDPASTTHELRVMHKNGEIRWVNIRWTGIVGDQGEVTGYVGTFEDISRRKRTEQINRVLYEISLAVQTTRDLAEFYSSLHRSLDSIIDVTNFYIALYDADTQTISFPYAREEGKEKPLASRKIGKGLTGYVIRKGVPVLLDEKGLHDLYSSGEAVLVGQPAKNWLGVPLVADNQVFGAVIIQSYTDSSHYTEEDVQTMNFVSSQIAAAIERKQAEEEAREYTQQLADAHRRIKDELNLAARIQRARLPKAPPPHPQLDIDWLFDSCEEVAGDMFNFVFLTEHEIGIYILDVSGHGVAAALLSMSLSRALTATSDGSGVLLTRENGQTIVASPAEVAARMNERYPMNLDTNQYFTMLYGILDIRDLSFRFVRGGHPPPILLSERSAKLLDDECGPAIGIIPNAKYKEEQIQLRPGHRLLLYTDGVDETTNAQGEEFGIERVREVLSASKADSISGHIRDLREALRQFSRGVPQSDDITILGLRIKQGDDGFWSGSG